MLRSSGCWVGIDVSKASLDIVLGFAGNPFQLPNTPAGFSRLLTQLQGTAVAGGVVESTGFYHRGIATFLWEQGYAPSIVNPAFIKNYRQSGFKLAKTDALDARLLARYGEERRPPVMFSKHGALPLLTDLVSARHDHVVAKGAWNLRRHNPHLPVMVQVEAATCVAAHATAIARLDTHIAEVIAADPVLAQRDALFQSVPGIALVRSATLLAYLPELGVLRSQELAALVGLAPHAQDSGHQSRHRSITGGRAQAKDTMVLFARTNRVAPIVQARRRQFLDAGKSPLVAAVAVARWMVTILNTMVTNNLRWEELTIVKAS